MSQVLQKLQGGDLRSIGRSNEVVQDVLEDPALFAEVFEGLFSEDPRVRMRCADVLEKVSAQRPELLQPFKERLIHQVSQIPQQEVQWHAAQMFSYLETSRAERDEILRVLLSYLASTKSNIVKVCSMQALADLAERDDTVRLEMLGKLKELVDTGSPAVVSRGRKLVKQLSA
ncbi:MAG TPA: hypothetical protein VJM51_09220 [Dehalococcoidia bacterium]|nr:hypothetical protein [Dehalococcoidia bacterium]